MRPVLFHLGPLAIPSHDAFVLAGALAALAVYLHEARRREALTEATVWIALGALVGGALLARASTAWQYVLLAPEPSLAGLLLYGGKSVLGGLAGAYGGALIAKKLVGYRASTGDLFAPAVALGLAVGRWGCFLSEQVGTPTKMPWGVRLSAEQAARIPNCPAYCAAGVPMHPSFLYESLFHAVAFALLWRYRDQVALRGASFKLYLLAYALFRFFVEFVRGNTKVAGGLSFSQWFLIPATLCWRSSSCAVAGGDAVSLFYPILA